MSRLPLEVGVPRNVSSRLGVWKSRQWLTVLVITVLVLAGGILAGVSQYASARGEMIEAAGAGVAQFETVFREASAARQQALRLGAEVLARDELVAIALKSRDRADLARRTVPLFEQVLRPRFNATVLDFPDADGVMFFRAHRPGQFGDDANERPMVATAIKARNAVSGLEIGRSGPELRAMTPVMVGDVLVGAVELGSSLENPLSTAASAASLDYAFAMDRSLTYASDELQSSAVMRKGEMLYLKTSKPDVGPLLAGTSFDPMVLGPQIVRADGREIFVQTLPIEDVGRRPVTRVTLVRDLTAPLQERLTSIAFVTVIGTLLVLAAAITGQFQFQNLRAQLERTFAGRVQELRDKAGAYDRLAHSMRDVQAWKLGFVNEFAMLIGDPLAALRGSLEGAVAGRTAGAIDNASHQVVGFALDHVRRLDAAVSDRIRMMSLRDGLVRFEPEPVDVGALVERLAERTREAMPFQVMGVTDPVFVMSSPTLLAASLGSIVDAVQRGGGGEAIAISVTRAPGEVHFRIASPGRWRGEPPTLDEAEGFAQALRAQRGNSLALAKLMIERFGGTLHLVEEEDTAGFAVVLSEVRV